MPISPDMFSFDIGGSETEVDATDIPYDPGSLEAKQAWTEIESSAHSDAAKKYAADQGYEDADGWYNGGPLRKGVHSGDTNFQLLVDRLHWYKGYDMEVATKIAGKVRTRLYG